MKKILKFIFYLMKKIMFKYIYYLYKIELHAFNALQTLEIASQI